MPFCHGFKDHLSLHAEKPTQFSSSIFLFTLFLFPPHLSPACWSIRMMPFFLFIACLPFSRELDTRSLSVSLSFCVCSYYFNTIYCRYPSICQRPCSCMERCDDGVYFWVLPADDTVHSQSCCGHAYIMQNNMSKYVNDKILSTYFSVPW